MIMNLFVNFHVFIMWFELEASLIKTEVGVMRQSGQDFIDLDYDYLRFIY